MTMLTAEGRKMVKDVLSALKKGTAKLAWIAPEHRDGDYDIRLDFKSGEYWFLSKTVLSELRKAGVEIPKA